MTDHADLVARLRARRWSNADGANAALDREAADALSRPVTEEMVERGALVLADAIGEPVYTSETADVVRHILTAALGEPAAGHDQAAGLPQFQPGVFYNEDLRLTEMLLRDAFTVWHPWGPFKGHAVDVGYDEKGELVGIKIWDDVRKPSARSPEPAGGSEPSDYHERHQVMEMEQADREAAIRAEATAKERERCAARVMDAYHEWWRLMNEHSERFAAWKRGGEEGPMPESRIGSLPDYIAAAIRGGGE